MSLIDYTSYDAVRAALGVTDEELEDDTLSLQLYEDHLKSDLDDISYDLDGVHVTLLATPVLTAAEERFMMASRLFATYSVAKTLTVTLPMFGPRSVEDGKAKVERFQDPYKATITAVNNEYEKWYNRLKDAFGDLGQATTVRTARVYAAVVTPASDPILGT